jgi:hypothetical protein
MQKAAAAVATVEGGAPIYPVARGEKPVSKSVAAKEQDGDDEEEDDSEEEEEEEDSGDEQEEMDAVNTENVPAQAPNSKKRKADVEPEDAPAKTVPKAAPGACVPPSTFPCAFCTLMCLYHAVHSAACVVGQSTASIMQR